MRRVADLPRLPHPCSAPAMIIAAICGFQPHRGNAVGEYSSIGNNRQWLDRKVSVVAPLILFCSDPLEPRRPDEAFAVEAEASEKLGFSHQLIDFEALTLDHDVEQFSQVARNVKSRFFTMDVAKRPDGDWLVVELGDGQVAGLPEGSDAVSFYRALTTTRPVAATDNE